jgi:MoxR-like ATPase
MVRIKIGYPPPQVEMRLLLHGGSADRARHVPQVIDPAQLVALQREVDRVEFDASLATYLQAVLSATRSSPTLSLGASPRAGMNLARACGRACYGRTYCIADDIRSGRGRARAPRLGTTRGGYAQPGRVRGAVRDLVARVPVPL